MQLILMLIVVAVAVYLIIKKYQPHTVLLLAGLLMVFITVLISPETTFLPKGAKSTGSQFLDVIELVRALMASRIPSLGLIIMATGGFAKYMDHIGAADEMVKIAVKPLEKVKNPYILLALAYIVGQLINIFVPSAAGLAMLLIVAMYPVLTRLGVTPVSAASVIATVSCLDLGPASGNTNFSATLLNITPMEYFIGYQVPVALIAMPVIALLIFVSQYYFDKKDKETGVLAKQEELRVLKSAPRIYAVLPLLPLILLIVFSKFVISTIKMDVVTAMIISMLVALSFEVIRKKNFKDVSKDLMVFFKGMGELFTSVVSLIICAEVFATGFIAMGGVNTLIGAGQSLGLPAFFMMVVMVLLILLAAFVTGSGNASFFAFGNLAPEIAAKIGIHAGMLVLPMQIVSGIGRSMSPVAGVVIVCAGAANVSTFAIVRRTIIPMLGGVLTTIIVSWFIG